MREQSMKYIYIPSKRSNLIHKTCLSHYQTSSAALWCHAHIYTPIAPTYDVLFFFVIFLQWFLVDLFGSDFLWFLILLLVFIPRLFSLLISGIHSSAQFPCVNNQWSIYIFLQNTVIYYTRRVQPLPDLISCTDVTCARLLTDNTYTWLLMNVISKYDDNPKYSCRKK